MESAGESHDRDPARVDTSDFLFSGCGLSALLIHGLSGTPYEMRYLGERLSAAGIRVRGVKLAGHGATPEDLAASNADRWYESVVRAFEDLRGFGDPNLVVGLSLGALLGARLAADQRDAVAGLVMLSPAFFLPRSITVALKALSLLGPLAGRLYVHRAGSDIHDDAARRVHPSLRLMPLNAPIELLRLSAEVRPMLSRITQPALIVHGRGDHTCPAQRNVNYAMANLASARKRAVILDHSYHVITVDSEKDRVADEVLAFAGEFRARRSDAAAAARA
jgi:carboxylesterase